MYVFTTCASEKCSTYRCLSNNSDEMFYCIEGEFDIEFLDGFLLYCIWVMVFRILPYLLRVLNAVAAASQPWNTENPRRGTPKIAHYPPGYLTSRFHVLKWCPNGSCAEVHNEHR